MFIYFILTFALGLMGTLIVPDTKGNWLPLDFSLKEQMSPELQTTTSITSFLYCLSVGGRKQGQLLPTTCSRIFTHIHSKLPTGLLLTGHKAESLDALLDWSVWLVQCLKYTHWTLDPAMMNSLVKVGPMEFQKSTLVVLLVPLSLLLSAGSLGHDLLWKLIFTKYVSCLM